MRNGYRFMRTSEPCCGSESGVGFGQDTQYLWTLVLVAELPSAMTVACRGAAPSSVSSSLGCSRIMIWDQLFGRMFHTVACVPSSEHPVERSSACWVEEGVIVEWARFPSCFVWKMVYSGGLDLTLAGFGFPFLHDTVSPPTTRFDMTLELCGIFKGCWSRGNGTLCFMDDITVQYN